MLDAINHDNVTVMFADVCGYTKQCNEKPNIDNLNMLNQLFTAFDELLADNDIEQVQIIGDAYMAISGHTRDKTLHATNMLKFAIAILGEAMFQNVPIKIGISSGPVISGKIGINNKLRSYYGNTVNMASRMESHSYPMCIHVSEAFVKQIIDENVIEYDFVQLGSRYIKGKGEVCTYLYCLGNWKDALEFRTYQTETTIDDVDLFEYKKRRSLDSKPRSSFMHIRRSSSHSATVLDLPVKMTSFIHIGEDNVNQRIINNKVINSIKIIQLYWRKYKLKKPCHDSPENLTHLKSGLHRLYNRHGGTG
jgi:class 3 adenylate cyclase